MHTSNYVVRLLPNGEFAVVKSDVRLTAKNISDIDSNMIFNDGETAENVAMYREESRIKVESELENFWKLFDFAD